MHDIWARDREKRLILSPPSSLGDHVGLRTWLIGMNPAEVKALAHRVQELEDKNHKLELEVVQVKDQVKSIVGFQAKILEDLLRVQKTLDRVRDKLDDKADKKEVDNELESLSRLVVAVYDKLKEMETVSELSSLESLEPNEKELLVLDYIRRGEGSPSKLLSRLKISSRDLYDILKRLEAKGKVRKFRKGRRVYYILVED